MSYQTIKYSREDSIGVITLDRPKVYNAINKKCRKELHDLIEEISHDEEVRVLIIKGHEKFFCAGADINEVAGLKTAIDAVKFSRSFQTLFQKVANIEKPTIAAISGFSLGGGFELALSCDFRIISDNAFMGLPEIDIGAFPAGGGTQILPRLLRASKAKELLYFGRRINAEEAFNMGLINKIVATDELMSTCKKWACELSIKSSTALAAIKRIVAVGLNTDLSSSLSLESETFGSLSTNKDFKEGVAAFIEKRKPDFVER